LITATRPHQLRERRFPHLCRLQKEKVVGYYALASGAVDIVNASTCPPPFLSSCLAGWLSIAAIKIAVLDGR
jgi:hypothetical protein